MEGNIVNLIHNVGAQLEASCFNVNTPLDNIILHSGDLDESADENLLTLPGFMTTGMYPHWVTVKFPEVLKVTKIVIVTQQVHKLEILTRSDVHSRGIESQFKRVAAAQYTDPGADNWSFQGKHFDLHSPMDSLQEVQFVLFGFGDFCQIKQLKIFGPDPDADLE